MAQSARNFAKLLTQGVHRIRICENKTIQIVHDELGYTLNREGGSAVEYWRKGHIPPSLADVEKLGREIVARGQLDRVWLEAFLQSADYPYPANLCDELFPPVDATPTPVPSQPYPTFTVMPVDDRPLTDVDPFIVGLPITHPGQFFGRAFELKRIFGLWRRFPLQNIAIIGKKRSGKTSLLHYLRQITTAHPAQLRPNQKSDWLTEPMQYRWVFVDFQDARMCRLESLLRYILTSLDMAAPEKCELHTFLDIMSTQLTSPAIILMDEIGAGLESPELDQAFWWSLRSLGSNQTQGKLAFLLTAHMLPAQLADEQDKPSPFFNIFGHTFTLGPLTDPEARELIASSSQPFAPTDVDWMLEQSQGWPCLLQALCYARLSALEYGETDDAWKQDGLAQMAPHRHLLD